MNIDEMPAGREIDALVAEKIMGMTVVGKATCLLAEGFVIQSENDGAPVPKWHSVEPVFVEDCICDIETDDRKLFGHQIGCLEVVPFFSTDIAAAWQVVEKLAEKTTDTVDLRQSINPRGWNCVIGNPDARLIVWAETAQMAICKAAVMYLTPILNERTRDE